MERGFDVGIRIKLVNAVRRLYLRGFNSTFSGNVSVRSSYKNHFWITPRAYDKASLTIEDLSLVDITTGNRIMGAEPSSEYKVHLEIYRARDDVNAVIHTHQVYTMVAYKAGLLKRELLEDSYEAKAYLGGISHVPRLEPGSWDLAKAVSQQLADKKNVAVIMDGHGVVLIGGSIDEALNRAEILEMEAMRLVNLALLGVIRIDRAQGWG
ncbi:class II aldolase/adducin family protein [Desulfurococcaceae archaeon AG1]|nr:class II aldolase/adducin family protein [Desulfurococcaceae archaeon AG1]